MIIPKSFKLFGRTFKVTQPKQIDGRSSWGSCNYGKAQIKVLKGLSDEDKEQTYLHEITHAILDGLEYNELSDDEKFVDLFSKALHQVLTTQE